MDKNSVIWRSYFDVELERKELERD